jgi:group I intron endonuclease
MKFGIIYIAKNIINEKIYIGQTVRPLCKRISQHYKDSKNGRYAFANALRKYNREDWAWEILYNNVPYVQLGSMEKWCIAKYDSYRNGYNSTLGGEDNPMNYKKYREKVSLSKIGKKRPDQVKRIVEINKNRVYSSDDKRKMSERTKGKNNPMYGKNHSYESKILISKAQGAKPFVVFKDNNFVGEWTLKKECADFLGIDNSNITKYLKGKTKNSLGYIFKYKDED